MLAKAEIVDMWCGSMLEHEDEVLEFRVGGRASGEQLLHVAPVHADVMHRTVTAERR